MPTLFERLDQALEGNELDGRLAAQVGSLTAIVDVVSGLIANPPDELGDLQAAISELPLPDLQLGGEFSGTLDAIREALPSDLSSVTGDLLNGLQQLQTTVGTQLTQVLQDTLEVVLAIYRLTQIDFTCEEAAAPEGGAGGPGGGTPPPGGGTPPPTQPHPVGAVVERTNGFLDLLPSPLNVEGFLAWLIQATDCAQRNALLPRNIPLYDDIRDPLETLVTWNGLTADQVRDQISAALADTAAFVRDSASFALAGPLADLSSLPASIGASTLRQIASDLAARLAELRTAVNSGDLSGTGPAVAAVNALLDQYAALRPTLEADVLPLLEPLQARLAALADDLEDQMAHVLSVLRPPGALADDLEDQMAHVLSVLRPPGALADLEPFNVTLPSPPLADSLAAVEQWLNAVTDWLRDLLDKLDLTAIRDPLRTVADGARAAVDGLDQGLTAVTLQVQSLFGEVESLLDQLDTAAIQAQVEAAIQEFRDELVQQLNDLFAPAREAVSQVVDTIDAAVDSFDPEDIIEALQQAVQSVTDVLQDPAVTSAVEQVKGTLDTVRQQVEALSFAPLTDEVVAAIEAIAEQLRQIEASQLPAPLQAALQTALSALPGDLTPFTDPVIDEFGQMIEAGPVPLVEAVREQPQRLLERVRQFEPAALLGDSLSQPYQQLIAQMEAFKPSGLLEPAQSALNSLKDRLRESASPGLAIQPLQALFDQLVQSFNALDPEALVAPLEQRVSEVINGVLDALPVDEVFDQVDEALGKIEETIGVGDDLLALLRRVRELLDAFEDPQAKVDTFISAVIARVESLTDTSPLEPVLQDLSDALDGTRASALLARFDAAAGALLSALEDLAPQDRLVALVQAYNGVSRQALAALPDSAEKAALTAALDRFNPAQPVFAAPYQALEELRQAIQQARASLQALLADWDERFHDADGTLAALRLAQATGEQLAQFLGDELGPQLTRPLVKAFAALDPVRQTADVFITELESLITDLQARLTDLLLGPDSLGGIRDALQELVQRLRDFNLDFLSDSLASLFANVRGKLEAISPAQLGQALQTAFEDMLDTLDLGLVLPPDDVAQLDSAYTSVLDKLKGLDPNTLVTEVLQPEFEETVLPLLEAFDLTPLLTAIVERLRTLDDELRQEMARVNEAYQEMLRSAPSVSVSAGVELPI